MEKDASTEEKSFWVVSFWKFLEDILNKLFTRICAEKVIRIIIDTRLPIRPG